jgi:hypothetical protein
MTRTHTLTLAALLAATVAQAQHHGHHHCISHEITSRYLAEQGLAMEAPPAVPDVSQLDLRGGTYTVPVVVHVVWNTAAENVSDATVNALIGQLNMDYSMSNPNLSSVRQTFQSVIGNVGFNFCLAQVDPNGNPTTGIVRVQTSATWFNPDTQTNAMKQAPLGSPAWNPSRYLNIWICDITSGATGGLITVGYAYLPQGGVVGSWLDGLVIDYNYGTGAGDRTATHEIGHYFGLYHPFDENGQCVNADGFTDTPTTNSPTFSCSNPNLMKCGVLTQYENFMDYSNCPAMFTQQQAAHMQNVITGIRSSLLTQPQPCSGGSSSGYCTPTAQTGTSDGDYINAVQLGSINNTNSGGTSAPAYTNFSATHSTSLQRGSQYTISIQGGSYQPDHYAAWIDYNQNNTFEANEKLGEFTTSAVFQTQQITFTVPANASLGNTRMRVRGVYHLNSGGLVEPSPTDPCYNYVYGETEDYGITITAPAGSYCIPTAQTGTSDGDFINAVQLGSINNTNTGGTSAPTYTNYTASHSTSLARGATYSLSIQGGSYQPDHYAAWIDYDQNNTFEANEKLGEFTTSAAFQTQQINFTVPANASLGTTRMRVRGVYHLNNAGLVEPSPTDPCYNYVYGETEDYGIVVTTSTDVAAVEGQDISLFPNPATDRFTVELAAAAEAYLQLIDLQGRVVAEHVVLGGRATIATDGLATGSYVVRVSQQGAENRLRLDVTALR